MPDLKLMDQAYSAIMQSMVVRGTAPHYTELAEALTHFPMAEQMAKLYSDALEQQEQQQR